MRTRLHQWLRLGKSGQRARVMYGVQAHHGGKWKHCHYDGAPAIYPRRSQAEKVRAEIRRRPS